MVAILEKNKVLNLNSLINFKILNQTKKTKSYVT
jgi:hypothetical protein